jgi:peptide/nickel transport system substrate-binding protein
MKRSCSTLLAFSSLNLLWANPALAASRPHYGGTLRIAAKETPASFAPAILASTGPTALSPLVFETLVRLDDRGRPQPLLATSWQADPGGQRWRFSVRSGVSFNDGVALDSTTVAAALRVANPSWKILPAGETVMIETDSPAPNLPAELALARNGISRLSDGKLNGTGPFTLDLWDAGKHVTLKANDQYWAGRPFLDSIEVDLGKNYQPQSVLFDLAKADVIEVAPENIHRMQAQAESRTVLGSQPAELMALIFARDPRSEDETNARDALAMSIDTTAVNNVVLQGGGEPAAALLPNWLSGYAFLFSAIAKREGARQERAQAHRLPPWTLGYDGSDPVARVVAERILLNARDAGIALQLTSSDTSDMRLIRIALASSEPNVALSELARTLQLPQPKFSNGPADLYSAEAALLQSRRVIPLLHLRSAVALRANVSDWRPSPISEWQIENVWLTAEKP